MTLEPVHLSDKLTSLRNASSKFHHLVLHLAGRSVIRAPIQLSFEHLLVSFHREIFSSKEADFEQPSVEHVLWVISSGGGMGMS